MVYFPSNDKSLGRPGYEANPGVCSNNGAGSIKCSVSSSPYETDILQGSHGEVTLSPPFSDLGYRPIPLLLISYKWRTGQVCVSVCLPVCVSVCLSVCVCMHM